MAQNLINLDAPATTAPAGQEHQEHRLPNVMLDWGLFSRAVSTDVGKRWKYTCLQPGCSYIFQTTPKSASTKCGRSHYKSRHPLVELPVQQTGTLGRTNTELAVVSSGSKRLRQTTLIGDQYTDERYITRLLKTIVLGNLSFRFVENPAFREMQQLLFPAVKHISRHTAARRLKLVFKQCRSNLIAELVQHMLTGGTIALTLDVWTARSGALFLGVTGHWINEHYTTKIRTLALQPISYEAHTGGNLARTLLTITDRLGITNRIISITHNNADNNSTMLTEFSRLTAERGDQTAADLPFHSGHGGVRCIAHVLNLVVGDIIKGMQVDQDTTEGAAPSASRSRESTVINKLRNLVLAIRRRRHCRSTFTKACTDRNQTFIRLQRDVSTCWNSVYMMIHLVYKREHAFKHCCNLLAGEGEEGFIEWKLTHSDWNVLAMIHDLFLVITGSSIAMQKSQYPTLGQTLLRLWIIRSNLVNLKEESHASSTICYAIDDGIAKLDKYLQIYQKQPYLWASAILDPRLNMAAFREGGTLVGYVDGQKRGSAMATLRSIYAAFQTRLGRTPGAAATAANAKPGISKPEDPSLKGAYRRAGVVNARASELDAHWALPQAHEPTDVLTWWADHEAQFPILAAIARAMHAIPASSAPAESVFSFCTDVLSQKRARLRDDMVGMIICLKSWQWVTEADVMIVEQESPSNPEYESKALDSSESSSNTEC